MKTTEDLVRELADREAIRELSARYCDCVWRKDLEGLLNLFTDDCAFIVEGTALQSVARGRGELRKMYEHLEAERDTRLLIHGHIVNLLGKDRATARCFEEAYDVKRIAAGVEKLISLGYYDDEYVKVGDDWKFASRRYFLDVIDRTVPLRDFMG